MKKYLITGGAGFIGSHTAYKIIENGDFVRIIDDLSTGFEKNIAPLLEKYPDQIELVNDTIENFEMMNEACKSIDYVIHLAALTSVPRSIDDPFRSNQVNIDGHLNVLMAARDSNVKRVVFADSAAVYGNSPVLPKTEDITPQPLSPYAVGKITGEYYMKIFYQLYGLETVCLRYFNIFGPRQNPNSQYSSAIPKFIKLMMNDEAPTIFGDGTQCRDFTFVANVVNANLLACEAEKAAGEAINIACGEQIVLLDVIDAMNKALGKDIKPVFTDPRKGDIKKSYADISKARNLLGYAPDIDFCDGISKTIEWYKENL